MAFPAHHYVQAQAQPSDVKATLHIPRLTAPPKISDFEDMRPSGTVALQMAHAEQFIGRVPVDDQPSSEKTQVFMGYDDANLYAVFVCFDSQPSRMRARRPNRDDIFEDDSVTVQIDTFRDQQRAYSFGVNAAGIQGDGVWVESRGWDLSFDAVYASEVKRTVNGYIALLAVPFRSMRFPNAGEQHWGLLLNRYIARTREDTFWPRYSSSLQGRLNQMGSLEGIRDISSGRNLQFIPYVAFESSSQLNQNDLADVHFDKTPASARGGLDAKAIWRDHLVMDVTANPDFSQVESDDPQVLVNQRFEVFFPEKRHFFIENASYLNSPVQLLFTRRIAKPDAGIRLTGKIGGWGIGILSSDDRAPGENLPPSAADFGRRALFDVARVTRDFAPQSALGVVFTHHQFGQRENLAGGADVSWKINNYWRLAAQALHSATNDPVTGSTSGDGGYAGLFHDGKHLSTQLEYTAFSPGFQVDTGFIPRVDMRSVASVITYDFRPEKSKFVDLGPVFTDSVTWDYSGALLEYSIRQDWVFGFRKNTIFRPWAQFGETRLRPVDFPGLPGVHAYDSRNLGASFASTPSNAVSFDASWGLIHTVNFVPATGLLPQSSSSLAGVFDFNYRPSAGLTITNSYLFTQLGVRQTSQNVFDNHIFRSRWLYQFTPRWSLRLTAQYNAVLSNPFLTSLPRSKQVNGDVLVTYRINHGTALYVGYNHDLQNYDPSLAVSGGNLLRSDPRLITDARLFFVKVSYLFRY